MSKVIKGPWGKRPHRHPMWAPLWEELCQSAELPSPAQEKVIAELVAEILVLSLKMKFPKIENPGAWLRGFVMRARPRLWPPGHSQDYNKILGALKEKKRDLAAMRRHQAGAITKDQIKLIWWLLRRDPYRNQEWLYGYIGQVFPRARRKEAGRMQPSLKSLTSSEAGHIIDVIQGKAQPRSKAS